jgi:rhodanese-related sulfurtransferase
MPETSDWIFASLLLALLLLAIPVFSCDNGCAGGSGCVASVSFAFPEATITADTLQALIKSGSRITILECRSAAQKKNISIPGARIIIDGTDISSFTAQLPATDSLIIVYPGLEGGMMASTSAALRKNGYLSVIEFAPGIHGWIAFGYEPELDAR